MTSPAGVAPDRPDAGARNLDALTRVAAGVADAVQRERAAGRVVLVVGGDCTITLGVVAGLQRDGPTASGTVRTARLDRATAGRSSMRLLDRDPAIGAGLLG